MEKRHVFISYHHRNDQYYKDELIKLNNKYNIFMDMSVDTGDISDDLSDQEIRKIIRDEYLKTTSVLILLVGTETKNRKHIDWEIFSSMYDGEVNKKTGILIITLPSVESIIRASDDEVKKNIFPDIKSWRAITSRAEYEKIYPNLPARIIDNLLKKDVKINIVSWSRIYNNIEGLKFLIDKAYKDKRDNNYDLSRKMRRKNTEGENN